VKLFVLVVQKRFQVVNPKEELRWFKTYKDNLNSIEERKTGFVSIFVL